MGRAGGGGRRASLAAAAVAVAVAAAVHGVGAQDRDDLVPIVPAGVPLVVVPVQSAHPTPGGAWPGGAGSMAATLEALGAELTFAFADQRGAEDWIMPDDVVARIERNPMVRVDPERLSYHGLLREPKKGELLYEPLHGQLRALAALFGTRLVLVPLAVWYEPEPAPPEATEGAAAPRAASAEPTGYGPLGRAVLLMALVDARRAVVLWHGTLEGDPAEARSPALLASLAQRVARHLSPS